MTVADPFTLTGLLAALREDLMDTDATAYRWSDAVLLRCIDQALDRYSGAAPLMRVSQVPTYNGGRIYPSPDGCWYVDRAEYPTGRWPKMFQTFVERLSPLLAAPGIAPAAAPAGPGSVPPGSYLYACTFLTATGPIVGETTPSPVAPVLVTGAPAAVQVSGIPTGPYGTVARNLYRTAAGGMSLLWLAQLADNSTATYLDNTADGSLGAAAPSANSTAGIPTIELQTQPGMLPVDGTEWVELTAAYRHQLDETGSTVPEQHVDALALGAKAYALYAYLTTTNDNFDYVDGQFRDRVDDTASPGAWRAHADAAMAAFEERLQFIKHESNAGVMAQIAWGDKPVHWDRL